MDNDLKYMKEAYRQDQKALAIDEVPVGAVIVKDGQIIARGYNQREKKQQVTKHAELIAIEKACRQLGSWRLDDCDLYVTLEPCIMCSGALLNARIRRVIYGASVKRWFAFRMLMQQASPEQFNHQIEYVGGVMREECSEMLSHYFREKRKKAKIEKKRFSDETNQ